jgi:hypothetical protein
LLAEYGAGRELVRIDGARYPAARGLSDQGSEHFVSGEQVVYCHWIGIQVEQTAAPANRACEVAQISERQLAADMVGLRSQRDYPVAVL